MTTAPCITDSPCRSELARELLNAALKSSRASSLLQELVACQLKTSGQRVFNGQPDLIGIQFGLGCIAPMHVMTQ